MGCATKVNKDDDMTNKFEENAISKEIESQAGSKFDPDIVDVFVKMMKDK